MFNFVELWFGKGSECDYQAEVLDSYQSNNIAIEGEPEFISFVNNCLLKIAEHGDYQETVSLLKKIRQVDSWNQAGMGSDGVFSVDSKTLLIDDNDIYWGASQIIHDATHYQRILLGIYSYDHMIEEELIAFVPQAQFLRDYCRFHQAIQIENSDGRHCLR